MSSFFGLFVHSKDVSAVDSEGINTISNTSTIDTVTTILLRCWGGDGVSIVSADEDDWAFSDSGKIKSAMEVSPSLAGPSPK
jgi:hypothetical protein